MEKWEDEKVRDIKDRVWTLEEDIFVQNIVFFVPIFSLFWRDQFFMGLEEN